MPYTILSVLFSLLYLFFDKTKYKVFAMGSSALVFFYGLSLDMMDHPKIQIFFKYKKPHLTTITYAYFFITLIAILLCHLLIYFFYKRNVYEIEPKQYSVSGLKKAFYITCFLSLFGLFVNLFNVYVSGFTIELLVMDPRLYEATFGFSIIFNYLYFLSIPATLIYIYLIKAQGQKVRFGKILVTIMILISGFHAIKATIFDAVLIPGFFFLVVSKDTKLKYMAMVAGALLGIYFIFSAFVRGGYYDSQLLNLASYIIPNYLNLFYNIETYQTQFTPFYNLFIPDKIQALFPPELNLNPGVNSTYSINPSYNMYTGLDVLYTDFNLLGPFFFLLIFGFAIYLYNNKFKNIIFVYLLASIIFNYNLSFYVYSYIKIKYFYYLIVMVIIHFLCLDRSYKNTSQLDELELKN